ncbi:hypothetical protein [Mycobacterium sp. GA-2829]|uniref:hypothetical protein n=1 Tax=Mycobacterium sp. GA-2829 TaxID=1772283 RepID=UPI000AC91C1D|nr:hypothetical protein [Mycobacterium sp. GA-2829]
MKQGDGGSASGNAAGEPEESTAATVRVEGCAAYQGSNPSAEEARAAILDMWNATPVDVRARNPLEAYPFDDAYALVEPDGVEWVSNYNCQLVQDARDKGVMDPMAIGLADWQLGSTKYMMAIAANGAAASCWGALKDNGYPVQNPKEYFAIPFAVCPESVPEQYR